MSFSALTSLIHFRKSLQEIRMVSLLLQKLFGRAALAFSREATPRSSSKQDLNREVIFFISVLSKKSNYIFIVWYRFIEYAPKKLGPKLYQTRSNMILVLRSWTSGKESPSCQFAQCRKSRKWLWLPEAEKHRVPFQDPNAATRVVGLS